MQHCLSWTIIVIPQLHHAHSCFPELACSRKNNVDPVHNFSIVSSHTKKIVSNFSISNSDSVPERLLIKGMAFMVKGIKVNVNAKVCFLILSYSTRFNGDTNPLSISHFVCITNLSMPTKYIKININVLPSCILSKLPAPKK